MNNLAEEQEFETKNETVEEAIQSAKGELNQPATEDTEDSDDGFEIEVVDDTPEEDQGKPRRAENAEPQVPSDDEVEKYSEGVQKRIKQLKFEYHEERRAKEEAARLQDEALKYEQQVKEENDKLRKSLNENEDVLLGQAKGRVAAEIDKAKIAYKTAYESGDPDALIEAQEKLSALQVEKSRYDTYKPKPHAETPAQQPQQQPQQQAQVRKPDQRALDWAAKNDWFEKDIQVSISDCKKIFDNFDELPEEIQRVLANMSFQLGRPTLSKFKNMIAAVHAQDYGEMANQMEDSRWYRQTTNRAQRLIERVVAQGVPH